MHLAMLPTITYIGNHVLDSRRPHGAPMSRELQNECAKGQPFMRQLSIHYMTDK